MEGIRDLIFVEVDRGRNDMTGMLVTQLDDVFTQISFHRLNALGFEEIIQSISSLIMDLPLVTDLASTARQISNTIWRASAASCAQCT